MLKGSIFEYWATGGTSSEIVPNMCDKWIKSKNNKIGRLKNETIEKIYDAAMSAKKIFVETIYANEEFRIDLKPGFELVFHPDVIGTITLPDYPNPFVAIVDTKYTASINEVWNVKDKQKDFMQALVYVYGFYHWTLKVQGKGVHLPFVYHITEHNDFNKPLHKTIVLKVSETNFLQFEKLLESIMNDTEFKPTAHDFNCIGKGNSFGACRFIDFCEEGRKLINKTEEYNFSDLT